MSNEHHESGEKLVREEYRRLQGGCQMILQSDQSAIRGAMLVVADDSGVQTIPYVGPEDDPREMSLWLLAAFMEHIADSASRASGQEMTRMEVAEHADQLFNDSEDSDDE